MTGHGKKARAHSKELLWEECQMQSYFTARHLVDYFIVIERGENPARGTDRGAVPLSQPEKELFVKLEKDYEDVKGMLKSRLALSMILGIPSLRGCHGSRRPDFHLTWLDCATKRSGAPYKLPPKKSWIRMLRVPWI
jgi:hypothetical protein